ncbi:prepilin-type N-terminal cleavage/methylation domain-containing protein [Pseudomonas inefficax]|uniref:prepilin-type N-terminal cleavage/methylation domain-containing protein n=1 Tax=Pseudomonas inefficax TaxID=2078786 RepID=UPI00207BC882|nr:prepilin-type N-terminal cleavage/methylation domain-containing protein [Pseudomonas inefficax]MCM8915452.1 prepilin-type N-terminal cleavage/methylation domain-containing protein [Pseudomonas inefficax]
MKRMQGFTLLEVLAALSLLGLLMVLAASSFKSSGIAADRTQRAAARMEQVIAAQRFLRQSLEGMHETPLFVGEAEKLEYLAAVPLGLGGQLKLHRLQFLPDQAGSWTLRVAFFDKDNGKPWGEPQVLADHMRDVRIDYRGMDEMHRDSGWLEHWPWPQRLPRLVRIKAVAPGSMPWPTLSVAVRTNQQTGIGQ